MTYIATKPKVQTVIQPTEAWLEALAQLFDEAARAAATANTPSSDVVFYEQAQSVEVQPQR